MTNLSPSTTSPEPGSPQPAGAFNWRSEKTADRPNDKRPIRPDRRPLDEQEKLVPVYTSSSAPAPHMMPFCIILLY